MRVINYDNTQSYPHFLLITLIAEELSQFNWIRSD